MRFLRMLTNASIAGLLGAAFVCVLVLQLNPHVPLFSATAARWFATLALFYGLNVTLVFYLVLLAREVFSLNPLFPGWISVRVLAWLAAASAAVAAALMWTNAATFGTALDEDATWRMLVGAGAMTAAAVVLLAIAVAHYSFGRRGSRVGATLFVLAVVASLVLPLAARGIGGADPEIPARAEAPHLPAIATEGPRVRLLLLDGASLDYIWPRAADDRLPNFGRLLETGAAVDLATVRPTEPEPVWTAAATGINPDRNGVRSRELYYARNAPIAIDLLPDRCFSEALARFGLVRAVRHTSRSPRARPLWAILDDYGIPAGIVRWPLTHPVEPLRGFLVCDRVHDWTASRLDGQQIVEPARLLSELGEIFDEPGGDLDDGEADLEARALRRDRQYAEAMHRFSGRFDTRLTALRFVGLDAVSHRYFRFTMSRTVGEPPDGDRRRYAQVVDRYYAFIDAEIGRMLDGLQPGDLLLVVSGFGMEPLTPARQLLGRLMGADPFGGTHESAPDGFLLAYGSAVAPGRRPRGTIADLTPTVLYFLGLPVGRDMDGSARTDLFAPAFTADRPIAFIPTHSR